MITKRFERILVAVDDSPCSEKALGYVRSLVGHSNASLALVTVVPATPPASYGADPLMGQQPIIVTEISEIQQQSAQTFLEKLAREFDPTTQVFTFNRAGSIRDEILATAKEWSADLIIMGTNGRTGFDHFLSGSIAEGVLRKSTCPVLVIPVNCED